MKVIVKEVFQDKFTGALYSVGQAIDVTDEERIKKLAEMKLIEAVELDEKPAKKVRAKKEV